MTLLDAHEIDPALARRRKVRLIAVSTLVVVVLGVGVLGFLTGHGWWFSFWPQERVVGIFIVLPLFASVGFSRRNQPDDFAAWSVGHYKKPSFDLA